MCVVGMGWDMPADAGLMAFDLRLRLAVVSCRADCNVGGVNRWSVWDFRHNNAYPLTLVFIVWPFVACGKPWALLNRLSVNIRGTA